MDEFFTTIFGDQVGHLRLSFLDRQTRKMSYRYLGKTQVLEAPEIVNAATERFDVYFTPTLFKTAGKGEKANVTDDVTCLWSDLDTCEPSKLKLEPSVLWESSPGRWQALWLLESPIPKGEAEDLSKRIAYAHADQGADKSGWDLTQLLRVPGTPNHKYENVVVGQPVVKRLRYRASDFTRHYGEPVPSTGEVTEVDGLPDFEDLPTGGYVASAIEDILTELPKVQGDRSNRNWWLMCRLAEIGCTLGQIRTVAQHYAPALDKNTENTGWLDADLIRFIEKPNGWQEHRETPKIKTAESTADEFRKLVEKYKLDKRARQQADRELKKDELSAKPVPDGQTLTELFETEWPDEEYLIDKLWPKDGLVLFVAQAKAGKTVVDTNLIRCLVDGEPFLDRYEVAELTGNVVLLNFEMSDRKMTTWLKRQGIRNHNKVKVWNLRGQAHLFNILDESVRVEWATKLRALDAQVVIFDCLTPVVAALGLDENHDLRNLLYAFTELVKRAGASEALATHHAGHEGQRSRGDSGAIGWGDANWVLVKEGEDGQGIEERDGKRMVVQKLAPRFLSANGRDVSVPKTQLTFDQSSLRLSITSDETDDDTEPRETMKAKIIQVLEENPDGLSKNQIELKVPGDNKAVRQAIYGLESSGFVKVDKTKKSHIVTKLPRWDQS